MRVPNVALQMIVVASAAMFVISTANAQQVPGQPPPPRPADTTITGCLKAGSNPSGVPDSTTYTLEPLEVSPSPSPTGAGPVAGKAPTRYTLTAMPSVQLKPHVGHKVELTGHLKDLSTAEPDARPEGEKKPPPQPGGAHNTFEVTALKMVAATCP